MKRTLFKNAKIVPMTERGKTYSFMGICNGKIDYLGNENPGGYDEEISLGGLYVFPGLCDSHIHLLYSIILAASAFNICEITKDGIAPNNMEGIQKSIEAYTSVHPKQKLIVINNYITPAITEHRLPYAAELDEWTKGKEVVVFSIDGHSCAMSTALINKLGLASKDGVFSGTDYDLSQGKITGYIASAVSIGTLAKGLANFESECFKYGITKVCALDGEEPESGKDMLLSLLAFLARRMDIKVRLFPQYMNYEKTAGVQKLMAAKRVGGCSKWELDGSVGSYSAAFNHPYIGQTELTPLYYTQEQINEKIRSGLGSKYTMTCHAIGTRAIDQIIVAYKNAEELIPKDGPMCRIDHFEFPSPSAIDFVKSRRLAITLQPGYSYLDKRYIKSYENHLCKEDIDMLAPVKDLAQSGVVILGSSDSPVQSINPYDQMLGMMDYYRQDQSIDAYEALKTYTYNSHLALAEPEGCLQEGFAADFFITDKDITSLPSSEIGSVRALASYINGRPMAARRGAVAEIIAMLLNRPHKI